MLLFNSPRRFYTHSFYTSLIAECKLQWSLYWFYLWFGCEYDVCSRCDELYFLFQIPPETNDGGIPASFVSPESSDSEDVDGTQSDSDSDRNSNSDNAMSDDVEYLDEEEVREREAMVSCWYFTWILFPDTICFTVHVNTRLLLNATDVFASALIMITDQSCVISLTSIKRFELSVFINLPPPIIFSSAHSRSRVIVSLQRGRQQWSWHRL